MKKLFAILLMTLACGVLNAEAYPARYEGIITAEYHYHLDLIASLLGKENPVILEAGGHYGNDTHRFANKWPKGSIISFEPNPNAYNNLMEAIKGDLNVRPVNEALADYNGVAILNVCYGTTGDNPVFEGASSILEPSEGMKIHYQGPKVSVTCRVLDDWCVENGVTQIDFMWLDLEGLEMQVLKSSPKILSTVKVIHTETNFFEFRKGMTQYNELRQFLEDSGFILLCHWYAEGLQGNAIFVRK